MRLMTRSGDFTFEDFCQRVQDGEKADLIDGVIYVASPDNTDAGDLFAWLFRLIGDFAEMLELGKVYGSRIAFRLSRKHSPEPDIAFLAAKHLRRVRRTYVNGPPDLAIEIVSPESIHRDYVLKRDQYEKHGVREYWIIDEMDRRVTLLRLGSDGKYREVRARNGQLHSHVLPGFWIRPDWLWQSPRPKKMRVLNEIVAGKRPNGRA
jgi:Uma2 family endonuclease